MERTDLVDSPSRRRLDSVPRPVESLLTTSLLDTSTQ
jgi:hypothetical protein